MREDFLMDFNISYRLEEFLNNDHRFQFFIFLIILISGLGVWTRYALFLIPPYTQFGDFPVYYNSVTSFLDTGNINYQGYYYPPLSILLFFPFHVFPLHLAFLFFSLFNILILLFTCQYIFKILNQYGYQFTFTKKMLIFLGIFLFQPVSHSLVCGQINILVLFLLVLFYYFLFIIKNEKISAFMLNISFFLKIIPGFLIFSSIAIPKEKKFLSWVIIINLLLWITSLMFFGIANHIEWLSSIERYNSLGTPAPEIDVHNPDFPEWPQYYTNMFNCIRTLLGILHINQYYVFFYGIWLIAFFGITIFFLVILRRIKQGQGFAKKPSQEWCILVFSLLISMLLVLYKGTEHYYATFLVLPFLLLIFTMTLDVKEKLILIGAVVLFSSRPYIDSVARTSGGVIKSFVYTFHPTMVAYLLFFFLIIIMIRRRYGIDEYSNRPSGWKHFM